MYILNDLHIGSSRKAGTTIASQEALREAMYEQFQQLLDRAQGQHLCILGDLFDSFNVEIRDVIRTHTMLNTWCAYDGNKLTLVMGNHDYSARGDKVSSFHLLAHMLCCHNTNVAVIEHVDGLTEVEFKVYAISHQMNQDLFNMEIEKAIGFSVQGVLLLHANVENGFAEHSDHSLNVDSTQMARLLDAGWQVVFAHEHQARTMYHGRVTVIGNQIPTSVADCLSCDGKYMVKIGGGVVEMIKLFDIEDIFARVDWRDLDAVADKPFMRIEGTATSDEASEVVDAVAKFRQKSSAYVVTNAVCVDGLAGFDELAELSFDSVTSFSVLDALLKELTPEEGAVIKGLLE